MDKPQRSTLVTQAGVLIGDLNTLQAQYVDKIPLIRRVSSDVTNEAVELPGTHHSFLVVCETVDLGVKLGVTRLVYELFISHISILL